jgi:hypothetical protein
MTLHWETEEQKGKRWLNEITQLGGQLIVRDRVPGIFFNGPEEAPENSLFIPQSDFGYTRRHGVFRKSLAPNWKSEIDL